MKIYVASKTWHAPMWRTLRAAGFPIISTWIDEPDPAPDYLDLWRRCVREAAAADALLLYACTGDTLKGGLIEVGAALGAGRLVVQVGSCASLLAGDGSDASFVYHQNWRRAESVKHALDIIFRQVAARGDVP